MDLNTDFIRRKGLIFCACDRNLITENALVGTAGVGEENGDNEWSDSGFWSLVTGHWLPVTKGIGPKVKDSG